MTNQSAHHKADEPQSSSPPAAAAQPPHKVGYESPEYVKARQKVLDIIPSVSFWDAIDRYAGHIALGLFGLAASGIFKGDDPNNVLNPRTTKVLSGTAIGTALVGLYAHYRKRMVSEAATIAHMEAYKTAETQLVGQSLANALEAKFPHANANPCPPGCGCPQHGNQTAQSIENTHNEKEHPARDWGTDILTQKQEAENSQKTGKRQH